MKTRMFVCRIVNHLGQHLTFIGPSIDHIPAGWSISMRRIARSK